MIIPIETKDTGDKETSWLVCNHLADKANIVKYGDESRFITIDGPFVLCDECLDKIFEGSLNVAFDVTKLSHEEFQAHMKLVLPRNRKFIDDIRQIVQVPF